VTRCPDNMFEARLDPRIPNSQLVLNSLAPVSDSRANGRRESFLLNFLITKPQKYAPHTFVFHLWLANCCFAL
jgi:hypothetical protein